MNFILENEPEIIEPVVRGDDNGLIHLPTTTGKEVPRYSEEQKEIIANDVLNGMTSAEAGKLHGVSDSLANKYANGKHIEGETKDRILSKKYEIQDLAVVKLMDTLQLLEPAKVTRVRDQIALMTGLSNLVDKIADKGGNVQKVELHLYAPNQKTEKDYEVIEGSVS